MSDFPEMIRPLTIRSDHYEFPLPQGWKYLLFPDEIILTRNDICARITVRPHMYSSFSDLTMELMDKPWDPATIRSMQGRVKQISKDALAINFTDILGKQKLEGRVITTVSEYGGGAIILAITESLAYFDEIVHTADAIAREIRYREVDNSEIVVYLSGLYDSGDGDRMAMLRDGTYARRGDRPPVAFRKTPYGEFVPARGMAAEASAVGNWSVIGDRTSGELMIAYKDGSGEWMGYYITHQANEKPDNIKFNGIPYKLISARHPRGRLVGPLGYSGRPTADVVKRWARIRS